MTPPSFPPTFHRVLMTVDTVGGIWTYALELSRGLAAHGVHVILATMGSPVQPHQRAEIEQLGGAVHLQESNFRLEWMEDPWSDVAAAGEWLLALEREFQPDLVHLNGYAHGAVPFNVPKLIVAHSCAISWWRAVKNTPPPAAWARYHTAVRLGLDQADLIVAPSHAMLASLLRNYGAAHDARVIYNGRDRSPFTAHVTPPHVHKEGFILSVGRLWDEAKNATALAAIAGDLPWPTRVAGDTRPPDGIETTLPNVHLLGRRTAAQLADEYRRAAIYALPARYEPFGLSVLEAALAGCALVLGDIPSLREIWAGAAVFVSPNDTHALRDELLDLIEDPYRRQALGVLAERRAIRFSTARMTAAYLNAYADLLSPLRRSAAAFTTSFA